MSQIIEPRVFLVSSTMMEDLESYLIAIGSPDWKMTDSMDRMLASDAETLCEAAGRMCYRSWEPYNEEKPDATNPNVSRVRSGNAAYLKNILKSGHGAICEHANIGFIIKDGSRVFTHEQVRHRAGVAYSQESLRFVRLTTLKYYLPTCIAENEQARLLFDRAFNQMEEWQKDLEDIFHKDLAPEAPFARKKELTSAFRRIAPDGLATSIMVTANIRALRHMIAMRTSPHAEEEIRLIYGQVAEICKERWPNFFQDMTNDNGHFKFEHEKV